MASAGVRPGNAPLPGHLKLEQGTSAALGDNGDLLVLHPLGKRERCTLTTALAQSSWLDLEMGGPPPMKTAAVKPSACGAPALALRPAPQLTVDRVLATIPVGVVVERRRPISHWLDFVWRAVSVLDGTPTAAPWTARGTEGDVPTMYAGLATIELYRIETANYRANLTSGTPVLGVVLRPTAAEPPYQLFAVTADPAEGEAFTEAGNDLIEPVPMPSSVARTLAAFVAEYHVAHQLPQRQRNPCAPDEPRPRRGREEKMVNEQ